MPCMRCSWTSSCGTARSRTSSVTAIAKTPSLKASVRLVSQRLDISGRERTGRSGRPHQAARPGKRCSYAGIVPPASNDPPHALLLGGGEAWMTAVLAGVAAGGGFDARRAGRFLGTSAGSIVAASLAAGIDPATRLERDGGSSSHALAGSGWPAAAEEEGGRAWLTGPLAAALALGGSAAPPVASLALSSTKAGGAVLRRAMLRRVPDGTRSLAELGRVIAVASPGFDGRLLVSAVDL